MSETSDQQIALEVGRVFTPAVPVTEKDLFAGRLREIRRIVDAINQRGQHAVIFGDRGVGKTSLANIISSKLTGNVDVLAPSVNCDTTDDFSSLWRKVLSQIDFLEKKRQAGFQNLTLWEETRNAAEIVGDRITPDELRNLFGLLGQGKILIIILDEFDRLEQQHARRAVADTIKTFSDHAVPATIVCVGVAETIAELISEHESIERAIVQVQMPRMTPAEMIEVLRKGTERLSMTIRDEAASFIAGLSQGLPHYTHLIGLHAARTALDQADREITPMHVTEAIGNAVDDSQASLRSTLRKAVSSPQQGSIYAQVMLACALTRTDDFGYFAPADVRHPMETVMGKRYEIPGFAKHLKAFCRAERGSALQKSGGKHRQKYRFTNALMPPLVIMKGLLDGRITPEMIQTLQRERENEAR